MLGSLLSCTALGSLTGFGLAKSADLFLHSRRQTGVLVCVSQNQEIFDLGLYKEISIVTPVVQELVRFGLESLSIGALSYLDSSASMLLPACAISLSFGVVHYCYRSDSSLLSALNVTLKGMCFSSLRHSFGLPAALVAHSVNHLVIKQSKQAIARRFQIELEEALLEKKLANWENKSIRLKFEESIQNKKQKQALLTALPIEKENKSKEMHCEKHLSQPQPKRKLSVLSEKPETKKEEPLCETAKKSSSSASKDNEFEKPWDTSPPGPCPLLLTY